MLSRFTSSYYCGAFLHPPQTKFRGENIGFTLSVCPPSVDMILSTDVLRNGCTDFSENVYAHYSPYGDVPLEFPY